MKGLGEVVAFLGLCLWAAWVTEQGEGVAAILWAVVVIWAAWADWGRKGKM